MTPEEREAFLSHGGLTQFEIQDEIRRNLGEVRACYDAFYERFNVKTFKILTLFVIDGQGAVAQVRVHPQTRSDASALGDARVPMLTCVGQVVKAYQYPKPRDGGVVQVKFPYTFAAPKTPPTRKDAPAAPRGDASGESRESTESTESMKSGERPTPGPTTEPSGSLTRPEKSVR